MFLMLLKYFTNASLIFRITVCNINTCWKSKRARIPRCSLDEYTKSNHIYTSHHKSNYTHRINFIFCKFYRYNKQKVMQNK